jgi:membrane protease YdiL (CAAX protease family)
VRSSLAAVVGLSLALAGPAVVAFISGYKANSAPALVVHVLSLACIMLIVLMVFALAWRVEGIPLNRFGFARVGWSSIVIGLALALLFAIAVGPFADWVVTKLKMGSFDDGLSRLAKLPTWYLVLTIVLVAAAEELLYRAYAIERLAAMTRSYWAAAALSLSAFAIAHVPLWGWGPALTTVIPGAIATLVYVWRRDVVALIIAHVVADLYAIVIAPYVGGNAIA